MRRLLQRGSGHVLSSGAWMEISALAGPATAAGHDWARARFMRAVAALPKNAAQMLGVEMAEVLAEVMGIIT